MSLSKLTIISFDRWMKSEGNDLFKYLKLPSSIDRDTLISNILLQSADFELLYSNPYFMQEAIDIWSKKWQRTFKKWTDALAIKYEPLNNYDRHEIYTDTDKGKVYDTGTVINKGKTTNTGTVTDVGNGSEKVSAFDSDVMRPNSSNSTDNTTTNDLTNTADNTQTNNLTNERDLTFEHNAHLYGNIGVTTSQEMLKSELDIAKWNIIEQITDLFMNEFCIMIYI